MSPLHLLVRDDPLRMLQDRGVRLVQLEAFLNSALIISKHRVLRVLVIVRRLKSRPGCTDFRRSLLIHYVIGTSLSIALRRPHEAQLVRYELCVNFIFVDLLLSEGAHSRIEGIHSPRHCVNEGRLVLVDEQVDLVGTVILLKLLALYKHLCIWAMIKAFHRRLEHLGTTLSIFGVWLLSAQVEALGVHELLHSRTFEDTLTNARLVVGGSSYNVGINLG